MKKLYNVLLGWACCLPMLASIQQPIHNFYKSDYGLGAQNRDVAQQQNGLMYFANMSGLLQYDGNSWRNYPIPAQGNNMRSLMLANNGDIYVGAFNEFGVFRVSANGVGKYESLMGYVPDSLRSLSEIWNINQVEEQIIFQSNFQLVVVDQQNPSHVQLIQSPFIMHYTQSIEDVLYIASDQEGLHILVKDKIIPLSGCEILKNKNIRSILPYKEKTLLIVTEVGELYTYSNGQLQPILTPITEQLRQAQVRTACIQGHVIAIGTIQNGVYTLDLKEKTSEHYALEEGLQSNTVLCTAFDNEGNLWLGLERGISYLEINSPFRALFPRNNPYGSGYNSLLSHGILYLGTNQGLYWTTYQDGQIGDIKPVQNIQGQVYKLRELGGKVYCCLHTGLYEVDKSMARKVADVEGVWDIQTLRSNPDYLLGGSYTGFFLLRKQAGHWVFDHTIDNFVESCRVYEQDLKGDIWMSHGLKGVYHLTLSSDLSSVESLQFYDRTRGFPTNELITVYQVNDELVYAAENGINRYNEKTDLMEYYKTFNENLMGGGQYYYMRQDGNLLWYVKGNKIGTGRIQPNGLIKSDTTKCFSIPEPLIYEYFDLTTLDANNLLISNEEGFTLVKRELLGHNTLADVYIRQIHSLKRDSLLGEQYIKKSNNTEPIRFNYKDNSLRFTYGTSAYSTTHNQIQYATRLIGLESEWSSPTSSKTREYTGLREGTYTFQVKSLGNNGDNSFTEVTFKILPPWYRTIWAYIIYGILTLLLIVLLLFYIQYKEHKVEARKEEEIQEQKARYQEENERKEREIMTLRNEQLSADLNNKSRELASSTMNLIRKNEILIDLKNELTKIQNGLPSTDDAKLTSKKLGKVINTINDNIEHDDDWMKFEQNFDTIHQDFMKRLGETYKGLTISDKKLCAYLKMNLVSKDIAPLLNISVRGVEIGRYRLRKKLNLDRDTNLTEFLQNF